MSIYLDYAASTPVHPEVLDEMVRIYRNAYGNASSHTHSFGQEANKVIVLARSRIAHVLGIDEREIIFTSGATESNNLAILGLSKWGATIGRYHIVSTAIEHSSVIEPIRYLESHGFEVSYIQPDSAGIVSSEEVLQAVREDTLLVSVMHANNETGMIQPVRDIGDALSATDVYFHVDASQAFGKLLRDLQMMKYDLLTITAHKIYGPQGVGALVLRSDNASVPPIYPLMYGGGQEQGFRPGTLSVALIGGFGKAAEISQLHNESWMNTWVGVKLDILKQLSQIKYRINGSVERSLPNLLNITVTGIDAEALMVGVRKQLALSNGSACSSLKYTPSHVLQAMGLEKKSLRSSIRMSWGYGIDEVDLRPLISFVRQFQ